VARIGPSTFGLMNMCFWAASQSARFSWSFGAQKANIRLSTLSCLGADLYAKSSLESYFSPCSGNQYSNLYFPGATAQLTLCVASPCSYAMLLFVPFTLSLASLAGRVWGEEEKEEERKRRKKEKKRERQRKRENRGKEKMDYQTFLKLWLTFYIYYIIIK
jgi:hypothetical protein